VLRGVHVAFVLFLVFLLYPVVVHFRHRVQWWDWLAALASLVVIGYMLAGGDDFLERAIAPNTWDEVFGVVLIVLVLEAVRRTAGWIMPVICLAFLAYAVAGPLLPPPWTHFGMDLSRIVGHMYMTLEGIFGIPVDVSSSLIILFTIYGAVLQFSGAGKFFIDFSFAAMGGKPTGAGRTIVLASFLLGGPSGSGVATTVTLGTVAYPMLVKAGYGRNAAGGLLAAGGLGAILSPPVLGAAAFLIAQFLNISYLDVILMATVPTLLYYFALFLMVEIDARKFAMPAVIIEEHATVGALARQYWFHFLSLVAIIVFLVIGFSATTAVFWTTITAVIFSFLRFDCALIPYEVLKGRAPLAKGLWNSGLTKALEAGSVGVLRGRWLDRRRGHTHRAGAEVQLDRAAVRRRRQPGDLRRAGRHGRAGDAGPAARRQTAADGSLHVADRLDRRTGGAGDGELHHLRRHRGTGADRARRRELCRAYVHLLLRGAVGSLAADGAFAFCGSRDHRRRSVQDDAAVVEVHDARVPGAVHVRARSGRPWAAADGIVQEAWRCELARHRRCLHHRDDRHRRARRSDAGLAVPQDDPDRALAARRCRSRSRLPEGDARRDRRGTACRRRRIAVDQATDGTGHGALKARSIIEPT
jgi:hypothetical protein